MTVAEMIARRTTELTAIKADSNAAVAAKGGTPADNLSGLPAAISSIPSGGELPKLTTPAEVGHVVAGKEYIDAAGNKQTGTMVVCDTIQEVETTGLPGVGVQVELESTADGSAKTMTLPEPNLLAENIKIGVSIFGVAGSAAGGGMVSASGTFTLSEDAQAPEITHNLGVIPDLVIVQAVQKEPVAYSILGFFALSEGYISGINALAGSVFVCNQLSEFSAAIANRNGYIAFKENLTTEKFVCAYNSSNYKYRAGLTYNWIAICGLPRLVGVS